MTGALTRYRFMANVVGVLLVVLVVATSVPLVQSLNRFSLAMLITLAKANIAARLRLRWLLTDPSR